MRFSPEEVIAPSINNNRRVLIVFLKILEGYASLYLRESVILPLVHQCFGSHNNLVVVVVVVVAFYSEGLSVRYYYVLWRVSRTCVRSPFGGILASLTYHSEGVAYFPLGFLSFIVVSGVCITRKGCTSGGM